MKSAYPLTVGWQLAGAAPGAYTHPDQLGGAPLQWHEASVPGTVAGALDSPLDLPADHDARDWWYRTTFATPGTHPGDAPRGRTPGRRYLCFDGLATLADVWLNGQAILSSANMFVGRRVDVTELLRDVNQLAIRFRALDPVLAMRRPRPKWRTALVTQQNLRWIRTTLLGRMPGWNPRIPVVGPWGAVTLECIERVDVVSLDLQAFAEGTTGRVRVHASVDVLDGTALRGARLRVGDDAHALTVDGHDLAGDISIDDVPLWWPHTHGTPRRLRCRLELQLGDEWIDEDLGPIGFRSVRNKWGQPPFRGIQEPELSKMESDPINSPVVVNGVPVFCRGAVWTTMDIRTLRAAPGELRRALEMARDAGVNMLRVGGTMHYECDDFYEICDDLGILVWQDFMFANMDYPVKDAEFRAQAEEEARHVLRRLQRHPCIAAYCGGSEIAQQAAMMGLAREHWSNDFFLEALPRLCALLHHGVPCYPSTPWGGALPFHVRTGIAHYYGVGAYRRPLADVKSARVRFAAECLAFANVPEPTAMAKSTGGQQLPAPHDPRWKAGVPRDNGAGWDFEDVRDHYLRECFGEDPVALRSQDLERYYALSRVVTGEVMARTFAEWRAPASGCGGALVWNWRDVRPGAGWGLTDSDGHPKAALWYLRRAWTRRAVFFTDEGLDGLMVHVVNDHPEPLEASIEVAMWRDGRTPAGATRATLTVPAHGAVSRSVDALFGYFTDATNAYRFGPPRQDVVFVCLANAATGEPISEDFHLPTGWKQPLQQGASIRWESHWRPDGKVAFTLESEVFLQAVSASCEGFVPDDNYFHVAPGHARRIVFTPQGEAAAFRASFEALNLR
ncbi:MAG: glycosyl hydrolase 2 galactose-binding domain-containing protein, partial [Betaproteobacteria bacterium]